MKNNQIYALIARSLCYPDERSLEIARELDTRLQELDEKYQGLLGPMVSFLTDRSREELEEAYTNTFDVQAVCPLEVGYALFGEDYKRGEFLVRMRDLHQEFETPLVSSELGDYLPNVLLLLEQMPEMELKKDFIEKLLMPGLLKMLKNFDESKGTNPFALPLKALSDVLANRYAMNPTVLEVKYE